MARHLMIQGTSSSVGKSVLVTAFCRIFARKGIRVAPFKAQNMALNSFVTPDGLEIGRSQAAQAQAAGIEMSADMNPILLKPEGDSRSQVVVAGKPWKTLKAGEYYTAKPELWGAVTAALGRLNTAYDLIVIEGAGSPAEINLKAHEIVNMRVARHLEAPVLLAADIDRGGVFAFLYGTLALLDEEDKRLVKGFLINKFRGDLSLLEPGLEMLADLTDGRPTLGVIPYMHDLKIAQEDSVFLEDKRVFESPVDPGSAGGRSGKGVQIGVVALPRVSNYDDIDALLLEPGVRIVLARTPSDLDGVDAILLPGTKNTVGDLGWLTASGMADHILRMAGRGTPVGGICGGYQMLGVEICDPAGVEGSPGTHTALGMLPLRTEFETEKHTVRVMGRIHPTTGFESEDATVEGYEIHMGHSRPIGSISTAVTSASSDTGVRPLFILADGTPEGTVLGNSWGTYIHGVFDRPGFRRAWLRSLGYVPIGPPRTLSDVRSEEFDRLADHVAEHLDMMAIERIIGL